MLRYKVLIGRSLRARTLSAQKAEAKADCAVINRMTSLGMPTSRKAARSPSLPGKTRLQAEFRTEVSLNLTVPPRRPGASRRTASALYGSFRTRAV